MIIPMARPQAPVEREGWDDFLAYTKFFGSTAFPDEIAAYAKVIAEYRGLYGIYDTFEQALKFNQQAKEERDLAEALRVKAENIRNTMAIDRDKLLADGRETLRNERVLVQAELDSFRADALRVKQDADVAMQAYLDYERTKQGELDSREADLNQRDKGLRKEEESLKSRKEAVHARETHLQELVEKIKAEL
jgi:hypothetical protein